MRTRISAINADGTRELLHERDEAPPPIAVPSSFSRNIYGEECAAIDAFMRALDRERLFRAGELTYTLMASWCPPFVPSSERMRW